MTRRISESYHFTGNLGEKTFQLGLTIQSDSPRIRPGLTAEVTLLLGDEEGETAYLVPVGALMPSGGESENYVYVFDAATCWSMPRFSPTWSKPR